MAKKQKENKETKQGTGRLRKIATLVFFATFALMFSAQAIYLFVCMIPTVVAVIVDRYNPKTLGITVGAANLAGTIPNWLKVLHIKNDPAYALQLVSHTDTLLLAYSAAGVGWLIYFSMTRFVSLLVINKTEGRVKKIQQTQKKLIDRWGAEVAQTKKPTS